jgi:hypothetical protein
MNFENKSIMDSITFCNKRVFTLDDKTTNNILKLFRNCLRNTTKSEIIPFENDVISDKHLVSIRLGDTQWYLFLVDNYCVFISEDEKHVLSTKFRFHPSVFSGKGTLISGEFYYNDSGVNGTSWSFYCNDILYYKGESTDTWSLSKRLETIYQTYKTEYLWDEYMNICHLELIPYFTYTFLDKLDSISPKIVSSIYFIPEYRKDTMYEFKRTEPEIEPEIEPEVEPTMITKQMVLKRGDNIDIYKVYDTQGNDCGIAYIKTLSQSKFLKQYFYNHDSYETKCSFNQRFSKWTPMN